MVYPVRRCVTFKFTNLGEKDKERSCEWLVILNKDPDFNDLEKKKDKKIHKTRISSFLTMFFTQTKEIIVILS